MAQTICVYCSSSNRVDEAYARVAERTGRLLGERGHALLYGGGSAGLMGALARSVHRHGGTVTGVIPEALKAREGVAYDVADELITTATMQERKAILFTRADAFLVLPGGLGTLEEFMEVLTLKQLGYHAKPIALVNAHGFYAPLLALFEHFRRERFTHGPLHRLYQVVPGPEEAFRYLEGAA